MYAELAYRINDGCNGMCPGLQNNYQDTMLSWNTGAGRAWWNPNASDNRKANDTAGLYEKFGQNYGKKVTENFENLMLSQVG